jgi:hypothetical protein
MSKNLIISAVLVVVVLVGVSFYGGIKYGQSKKPAIDRTTFGQRNTQMMGNTPQGVGRILGGMVSGEILSIENNSLTIKSQDGGSRIIFISASTTINKMAEGNIKDLIIGSNVSINGSSNTDNSINAQAIQIRPSKVR